MQLVSKFTLAFMAIALTVVPGLMSKTIAKAQALGGIPACAQPALGSAIQASGCEATQVHCICSDKHVFPSVLQSIQGACSPADIAAIEALGKSYCGMDSTDTSAAPAATVKPLASSTSLPSMIPAPKTPVTTSLFTHLPLDTYTTSVTSATYHKTMTYSTTSTASSTSVPEIGGAAETGASAAALALAVAGLGWVFAEL